MVVGSVRQHVGLEFRLDAIRVDAAFLVRMRDRRRCGGEARWRVTFFDGLADIKKNTMASSSSTTSLLMSIVFGGAILYLLNRIRVMEAQLKNMQTKDRVTVTDAYEIANQCISEHSKKVVMLRQRMAAANSPHAGAGSGSRSPPPPAARKERDPPPPAPSSPAQSRSSAASPPPRPSDGS